MNSEAMLAHLRSRRSIRVFRDQPVPRDVLERLLEAAVTAPSATNRQPWRFAVVTSWEVRDRIVEAVRSRTEEMRAIVARGHHADDLGDYWSFFYSPLIGAQAIVVPQYRAFPDVMAALIESGGGDPTRFATAAEMNAEVCATSAAVMALLLQAHAEGLGACWMSGPMVAREDLEGILSIRGPWHVLGAVALGYPSGPGEPKPRKPVTEVAQWF